MHWNNWPWIWWKESYSWERIECLYSYTFYSLWFGLLFGTKELPTWEIWWWSNEGLFGSLCFYAIWSWTKVMIVSEWRVAINLALSSIIEWHNPLMKPLTPQTHFFWTLLFLISYLLTESVLEWDLPYCKAKPLLLQLFVTLKYQSTRRQQIHWSSTQKNFWT